MYNSFPFFFHFLPLQCESDFATLTAGSPEFFLTFPPEFYFKILLKS